MAKTKALDEWGRSKARQRYAEGGVTTVPKDSSGKGDRFVPEKIADRYGGADLPTHAKGTNQREYYDNRPSLDSAIGYYNKPMPYKRGPGDMSD